MEETNECVRFKEEKVIKTIKGGAPDNCTIVKSNESLRVELSYTIKQHLLKVYFNLSSDSSKVSSFFVSGLMKLSVENSLLVSTMRKALEAKDIEIEEYKRNGATLIRGEQTSTLVGYLN